MSSEKSHPQRPASPPSYERSLSGHHRGIAGGDDGPNRKEKNYRRYASGVERSLALFETTLQEWADYISFLSRLLKALQARPNGSADIPHKAVVAKRLAQCLNPDLPSGVHQKTLEVYAYIFSALNRDTLGKDLYLYLPGLSPVLAFASLSVKPALLSIFETFILAISPSYLRSALKAILLALLPGLEEETSEEFERAFVILNKFRAIIGRDPTQDSEHEESLRDQLFWQCLFLASITSSTRRQGALSYLTRSLPKLGVPFHASPISASSSKKDLARLSSELDAVASPEPGLLIRCFDAGLRDEHLLIQRGFLDLLVTHLPLHSVVLHTKVAPEDLERLIAAATSVVSRREMSLNRRLWTWFLGPDSSRQNPDSVSSPTEREDGILSDSQRAEAQSEYFERYGLRSLVSSIRKSLLNDSAIPLVAARPFRICLSLMDRWEIGGLVVPLIFWEALESVWRFQRTVSSKESFAEVLRSATVFFDGIESDLIWRKIIKVLQFSFHVEQSQLQQMRERLDLVLFVVTKFNMQEEEMLLIHIPTAALLLLLGIQNQQGQPLMQQDEGFVSLLEKLLTICSHLVDLISSRALAFKSDQKWNISIPTPNKLGETENEKLVKDIKVFYEREGRSIGNGASPILLENLGRHLLNNAIKIVVDDLTSSEASYTLKLKLAILERLARKFPSLRDWDLEDLLNALRGASKDLAAQVIDPMRFEQVLSILSALEALHFVLPTARWQSDYRIRRIIPDLTNSMWSLLSPSRLEYNVEAARCIFRLRNISPESELVESSITALMIGSEADARKQKLNIEAARRFLSLWTHSMLPSNESLVHRSTYTHGSPNQERKAGHSEKKSFLLSRPLLLLIDSLSDSQTEIFFLVKSWISSRSTLQIIIDFLLGCLQRLSYIESITAEPHNDLHNTQEAPDDQGECLYFLQIISNLIQHSDDTIWPCLLTQAPFLTSESNLPNDNKDLTDPTDSSKAGPQSNMTSQIYLVRICLGILRTPRDQPEESHQQWSSLRLAAAPLLLQLLIGIPTEFIWENNIDIQLIEILTSSIRYADVILQAHIMELILCTMKLRTKNKAVTSLKTRQRAVSRDSVRDDPRSSVSLDKMEREQTVSKSFQPPTALLDCLILGLGFSETHVVLEHWVQFLDNCLPFYVENMFQILMPLVDCFIKSVLSIFHDLQESFEEIHSRATCHAEPMSSIITLLNGLEHILAMAHEQLMRNDESTPVIKSPEQAQGFFGNMVSGVFMPETNRFKNTTANNRLTVLLCFKDTVRLGLKIWSWGDNRSDVILRNSGSASFNYACLRLKNRIRRVLEHIFVAEALECLETLIEAWYRTEVGNGLTQSATVFNLLRALDGSRPRNTIPAIFNALYSRTNPNALDPNRKSTLTSDLSEVALAGFLVDYTRSLEDDAIDEIWNDCLTFLKDVLTNPLPHRQTLPKLLEFTAILGEKVDNTNFGEQRKMRRELGDLFLRILAASFTTKPLGFSRDASPVIGAEKTSGDLNPSLDLRKTPLSHDITAIIASILPHISKILTDGDRILAATATISTQVLLPTIRWKSYPQNVTQSILDILYALGRIPEASKTWRKDVAEAFNDSRFFCAGSLSLVEKGWLPILRQWALLDKDRMSEFLAKLSPPTSAGIMFGVGASSARLEADRKTQLTLRRMAVLVLAAADDAFIINLAMFQEKLVELMTATAASSPSSATRAEIFMVLRALILKTSPIHLASFWPIIHSELSDAVSSLFPDETRDTYNVYCVLQACKLLEVLLIMAPDDFQMREWLFITDTIYAVYRPADWDPVALVDVLAEDLDSKAGICQSAAVPLASATHSGKRKPSLVASTIQGVPKEDLIGRVLRPFFRHLSINAFESTYSMEAPDWQACYKDLLIDLFDDSTVV